MITNVTFEYKKPKNRLEAKDISIESLSILKKMFEERSWKTKEIKDYEEFANYFEIESKGQSVKIWFSNVEGEDFTKEYLLFVEPYIGFFETLFHKDITSRLLPVLAIIESFLKNQRKFKNVTWYTNEEWNNPKSPNFGKGSKDFRV